MESRQWSPLEVAQLILTPLVVVGVVLLFVETPFNTLARFATPILLLLSATSALLERPGRLQMLRVGILGVVYVALVPRNLDEASSTLAVVLGAGLVILFFALPFPALVYLVYARQDEFQRSLATSTAAIAFLVTMAGAAGYWVLQQFLTIPELEVPWVLLFGAVAWLGSWVLLRVRMLR